MTAAGIEPRRLALRYAPPGIIVEYARPQAYRRQLFHHEIDLRDVLPTTTDRRLSDIIEKMVKEHGRVLEDVPTTQLERLLRKLNDQCARPATEARIPASPGDVALPQADYNKVSETQLRQVKQRMDVVFEKNIVRPGDAGYKYDKQIVFKPAEEASDWDD